MLAVKSCRHIMAYYVINKGIIVVVMTLRSLWEIRTRKRTRRWRLMTTNYYLVIIDVSGSDSAQNQKQNVVKLVTLGIQLNIDATKYVASVPSMAELTLASRLMIGSNRYFDRLINGCGRFGPYRYFFICG